MKRILLLILFIFFTGSGYLLGGMGENKMTLNEKITKALELSIYYLGNKGIVGIHALYISPAQQLRDTANKIEKAERDFIYIENVLSEWKNFVGGKK